MTWTAEARTYWLGTIAGGGLTTVPRWTRMPREGVATHEMRIPGATVRALHGLAQETSLGAVLLAAHAKVLAGLSGDPDVTTGLVVTDQGPMPCRLSTEVGSWRDLIAASARAESAVRRHRDFPLDSLRRELGLTGPAYETELDPRGGAGDLQPDSVFGVVVGAVGGRSVLRLHYRTEAIDADCAERITGYHLAALSRIADEPDADPGRASLLSAEEIDLQLEGFAGSTRALPDRRVHELFEQQVASHPDDVAAVCGTRRWTYGELNARANRIAGSLLARGLEPEEVVAVVTERNLDWMAAVLAVFKAGGTYLPIEPQFPAERIATSLSRSGCRIALTEAGSAASLDVARGSLPAVESLPIEAAYAEGHSDANPDVPVAPDQLAYLFFTSGSTGEPKGAMCEHAGMLNHVYAKIDDLHIDSTQVVAQIAPQCFDISVWQLVSALLVGGRTLIVEPEVVLDVERFVDTVVEERVCILQVVPSYLDAILGHLERHPRSLPDLQCVSATGEALTVELARRWFETQPGIRLVNAYGLTETSDDTNHAVMERVPDRDRIPLGRPIANVHVYVVDENLSPVPLGAPGEIVFSGVCVGRGYVNDPDRTRAAFLTDPHRQGERLYRSGDYGRWLPDGALEFLGRRDHQVKVNGFRIEIGEIENALARSTEVQRAAVVVADQDGHGTRLIAFCTGPRPFDPGTLRALLERSLPTYMIPAEFRWKQRLPLTDNGKIDRNALASSLTRPGSRGVSEGPTMSANEHRLANAWAQVLEIPVAQINAGDHFFDRGGTSLSALRLVVALDRAVSLQDVNRHPVLADLATVLDDAPSVRRRSPVSVQGSGPAHT